MRKALIYMDGIEAGMLEELGPSTYQFVYVDHYQGYPVSLTMPLKNKRYVFNQFPPFFEGLLPEGIMLDALLRKFKLDKDDYFGQLIIVGQDVVGAVTIKAVK